MITSPGIFRLGLAAAVVLSHLSAIGIGRPAVFAFFALSGYWVTKMGAEKYDDVFQFYKSRFLRIFLPFSVAYALGFFLLDGSADKLLGFAIFGIASTHKDVLGVSWSLDIELQFYALVPLLLLVGFRAAAIACIALFVLAVGCIPRRLKPTSRFSIAACKAPITMSASRPEVLSGCV